MCVHALVPGCVCVCIGTRMCVCVCMHWYQDVTALGSVSVCCQVRNNEDWLLFCREYEQNA